MNQKLYYYDNDFDNHFDMPLQQQHLNKLYHNLDRMLHLNELLMMKKDVDARKNKHLMKLNEIVFVDEMDMN